VRHHVLATFQVRIRSIVSVQTSPQGPDILGTMNLYRVAFYTDNIMDSGQRLMYRMEDVTELTICDDWCIRACANKSFSLIVPVFPPTIWKIKVAWKILG